MIRIRKVKLKSESTAIQLVQYTGHSANMLSIWLVPGMMLNSGHAMLPDNSSRSYFTM